MYMFNPFFAFLDKSSILKDKRKIIHCQNNEAFTLDTTEMTSSDSGDLISKEVGTETRVIDEEDHFEKVKYFFNLKICIFF